MQHEAISQLFFSQAFIVRPEHAAASMFRDLPCVLDRVRRRRPTTRLAPATLLALFEAACRDALRPHLTWPQERLLGGRVCWAHTGVARVGQRVTIVGFVIAMGDDSVEFAVQARTTGAGSACCVAEGQLAFHVKPEPVVAPSQRRDAAGDSEDWGRRSRWPAL